MVCILNNLNQFKLFTIYQTHIVCILNNLNQFKLFTIYQTHIVCIACLNRTFMSFSNKFYILFLSRRYYCESCMENGRLLSCKRQLPSVPRLATSHFLINTLINCCLEGSCLDWSHTFTNNIFYWLHVDSIYESSVKISTFISTIGYLKMLLIINGHVASLSSS